MSVKIKLFQASGESELRFEVNKKDFLSVLNAGYVKISKIEKIIQKWIMKGDTYKGRLRITYDVFNKITPQYYHTVKHHVSKTIDYEVTTDLSKEEYDVIDKIYKDIPVFKKMRLYIEDKSGLNSGFIITVDYPEDKKDVVYIEFEKRDAFNKDIKFVTPEWLRNVTKKN